MFFTYHRAKEVWRCLGLSEALDEILIQDKSGSVIVEEIIRKGGRLQFMDNLGFAELVLCAGWYIWWERRKKVHDEEVQVPYHFVTSIVIITKNYMQAVKKPQRKKEVFWSKPMEGMLKINVDAAFDSQSGRGAAGVVIRNYTGQCIAAAQRFIC
jgi:hypothetical protein